MSRALHILIDNNLPRSLVIELRDFWGSTYPDWRVEHENDIAKPSTLDQHWIPRLRDIDPNRDWVIITKDKGHGNTKDRDKLPWLCKHNGHAYIIVLETIKTGAEQKAALASVWRDFPLVVEASAKIKNQLSTHVKLGRYQLKHIPVGYLLRVKNEPIQSFLHPPIPDIPLLCTTETTITESRELKQARLRLE